MSYSKSNLGSDSIHLTDRLCIDSSKEKPASEVGLQTTEQCSNWDLTNAK